ncbi:caspase family protein, partial [Campylobacter jejuni]|nr:caspase family protein [Campylobacter jejuni]
LDIVFYSNIIEYYKNNWHDWEKINTEDWIKSKEGFCDKDKILDKIQIIIKNYNQKIIDNIFNILKQEDLKIRE